MSVRIKLTIILLIVIDAYRQRTLNYTINLRSTQTTRIEARLNDDFESDHSEESTVKTNHYLTKPSHTTRSRATQIPFATKNI